MAKRTKAVLGAVVMFAAVLVLVGADVPRANAVTSVTVNVTGDIDDGNPAVTTLREAVTMANTDAQATEIILGVGLTYHLTLCGAGDDTNVSGDLDHTDTAQLTIFGNGSTIMQNCPGERVLTHFESTKKLVIHDTTITGGNITGTENDAMGTSIGGGGGILSLGQTLLDTVTITGNSAEDLGSGLRSLRETTITDSAIDANTGTGGGAVIGLDNDFEFTSGLLNATNSSFDNNADLGLGLYQGFGSVDDVSASSNGAAGIDMDFFVITITGGSMNNNDARGVDGLDGGMTLFGSEANMNGSDGLNTTGSGWIRITDTDLLNNQGHGAAPGCDGLLFDVGEDDVAVRASTITGNLGDGVESNGCQRVVIENSTISNNNGGVTCQDCGSLRVEFSTISNNNGSGIEYLPTDDFMPNPSMLVRGATIADNTASEDGGGINAVSDGSFDISVVVSESTSITGNTATDGNGGGISVNSGSLVLFNSGVSNNTAGDPDDLLSGPFGNGGGVYVRDGDLNALQVTFDGNRANGNGGAIAHDGFSGDDAQLASVTVDNNEAIGTGGGIDIDNTDGFVLGDSSVTNNNSTAQGGGVAIRDAVTTIERTTIADNQSGAVGPGVYAFESQNPGAGVLLLGSTVTGNTGPGGAVHASTLAPFAITNSTISGNTAVGMAASLGSDFVLRFVTAIGNTGGNISTTLGDLSTTASVFGDPDGGANCSIGGTTLSSGSNADTDGSCGLTNISDQPGLAGVGLGALAPNGGTTDTHAILAGSALRDEVVPVLCDVLTDQRGEPRPSGIACDIGAFEATSLSLTAVTWARAFGLGQIDFPLIDLIDLGNYTPNPTSLVLVSAPEFGEFALTEQGVLQFTNNVAGDGSSPVIIGTFEVIFEVCATEAANVCGQGTVVLEFQNPSSACTITGTEQRDLIFGTPDADVICSYGGNDTVFGLGGNDIIIGGSGRDVLVGGRGDDVVLGEDDRDFLLGKSGTDWLDGGEAHDVCFAHGGTSINCEYPRRQGPN